ncbi:EthD domain-containing protein (plasmid) [Rhizobium bangladeshense]|uniref:EthD domain-containing protein n=1 Tax=Rhizobium bangladeshense TaxID=1138189 RepID=UPI001A98F415|nr:EthD domain-containing protein [Rhizobium bangladeshense]QSY97899.1 EthD domain-containing protein [Rhizobium bangladeshense]
MTLIKTVTLLKRRRGDNDVEFESLWADVQRSSVALNSCYTRNRFKALGLRGEEFPFDGIATRNVIGATSHLFERELAISDSAFSFSFEVESETIKHGDGALKLVILSKRNADLTPVGFRSYWRDVHGKLTLDQTQFSTHLRAYRQNYVRPGSFRRLDNGEIPGNRAYDGMMEMWFDNFDGMKAAFQSEQYKTVMFPDEANFITRGFSIAFVADELLPNLTEIR